MLGILLWERGSYNVLVLDTQTYTGNSYSCPWWSGNEALGGRILLCWQCKGTSPSRATYPTVTAWVMPCPLRPSLDNVPFRPNNVGWPQNHAYQSLARALMGAGDATHKSSQRERCKGNCSNYLISLYYCRSYSFPLHTKPTKLLTAVWQSGRARQLLCLRTICIGTQE